MAHTARRAKPTNRGFLYAGRLCAVIGITLLAVVVFLCGILFLLCRGPSPNIRDIVVCSVEERFPAWRFLPRLFLSEDEWNEIIAAHSLISPETITDSTIPFENNTGSFQKDAVELLNIEGDTYHGKLIILYDPQRLSLAIAPTTDSSIDKLSASAFAEWKEALAAVCVDITTSAEDQDGFLLSEGILLIGDRHLAQPALGFTGDGHLVVGTFSPEQALQQSVHSAISAGPALIINSQSATVNGNGSGLSPRTVIGQRADGAVLLLVVDRDTWGITYKECIRIMLQQQAINATVLSSQENTLIYNGDAVCADSDRCSEAALIIK